MTLDRRNGDGTALSSGERLYLEAGRVGRLATVSATGTPQVTPICYVFLNNCVYTTVERDTQKLKNIQKNPCVAMVIDDYNEDWSRIKALIIWGKASVLESGEEYRLARDALLQKYSQYKTSNPIVEGQIPVLKVDIARKVSWDYGKSKSWD